METLRYCFTPLNNQFPPMIADKLEKNSILVKLVFEY